MPSRAPHHYYPTLTLTRSTHSPPHRAPLWHPFPSIRTSPNKLPTPLKTKLERRYRLLINRYPYSKTLLHDASADDSNPRHRLSRIKAPRPHQRPPHRHRRMRHWYDVPTPAPTPAPPADTPATRLLQHQHRRQHNQYPLLRQTCTDTSADGCDAPVPPPAPTPPSQASLARHTCTDASTEANTTDTDPCADASPPAPTPVHFT